MKVILIVVSVIALQIAGSGSIPLRGPDTATFEEMIRQLVNDKCYRTIKTMMVGNLYVEFCKDTFGSEHVQTKHITSVCENYVKNYNIAVASKEIEVLSKVTTDSSYERQCEFSYEQIIFDRVVKCSCKNTGLLQSASCVKLHDICSRM